MFQVTKKVIKCTESPVYPNESNTALLYTTNSQNSVFPITGDKGDPGVPTSLYGKFDLSKENLLVFIPAPVIHLT